MKLSAQIGTLKFSFETEKDLLEKVEKEKAVFEKQAAEIQAAWEKEEKAFKEKMKPVRKNLNELQEAAEKLKAKINGN